jgi:glycosyltransferase involved in cell wall biosynthesis
MTYQQPATKNCLLSIVIPTYNNWRCLQRQFSIRERFPSSLALQSELIVVDDHSDSELPLSEIPVNTLVVRIRNRKDWNQSGARNLGVAMARGDWMLLNDVDHFFELDVLETIVETLPDLSSDSLYRPQRIQEAPDGTVTPIGVPMNIYVIRRDAFEAIGGVDEDFAGHYGYEDREFVNRWRLSGRREEQHPTAICRVDPTGKTPMLDRDVTRNRQLLEDKKKDYGRVEPGPRLQFSWSTVMDTRI